jgi:hypothetical protein
MYILNHFDWFGPIEELEEIDKKLHEIRNGSDGVEFLGRFSPLNKRYHWTYFFKAKDFNAWVHRKPMDFYKRDKKVEPYTEQEFYE